jgi:hypothetical protein
MQDIVMPERPTLKKLRDQDSPSTASSQARPVDKRFFFRVDGQVKTSFSTKEHAVTAGAAMKKAFPSGDFMIFGIFLVCFFTVKLAIAEC